MTKIFEERLGEVVYGLARYTCHLAVARAITQRLVRLQWMLKEVCLWYFIVCFIDCEINKK